MLASDNWRPDQMPTLLINQFARIMAKHVDDSLRLLGITSSQLPVLVALKGGVRLTQKELAELACVEQPSMAQLLTRMERDGLVRREPSPNDRRSSLIRLTDHALAKLEPGRAVLHAIDREACAVLTSVEREALIDFLQRILAGSTDST